MPRSKRTSFAVVERPSPNFNDRKGQAVQFLVLHYTAMASAEAAIQRLCDPAAAVSSHYVVGNDGTIYRLVPEDKRAWHAGVSYWDGHTDLNTTSVGIEIDNDGTSPYPRVQMDAVKALCRDIVARHKIKAAYVVAHSDIAPDRKQDPGKLFDWQGLSADAIGLWPTPTSADASKSQAWGDAEMAASLNRLGYRSDIDLTTLVTAFQRHFQPEAFKPGSTPGKADSTTKARLACLLRRKAIADGMRASAANRKGRNRKKKK